MRYRFDEALRRRVTRRLHAFDSRRAATEGRRRAAVAAVLTADEPGGEAQFLITRRSGRLGRHAGQWALPGGRLDRGESEERAALRELHEELGLALEPDAVLGHLDDYPTRSGFVITPVVMWAGVAPVIEPDPGEVAACYRVPLAELDRPGLPSLDPIPESDRPVLSLSMPWLDTRIYAPTAAVLYQLREVILHGRGTRVDGYDQPKFAWR